MKLQEIADKFQGEWVLIEYTQLDEDLAVVEGEVIVHSMNKEEIYKKQLDLQGKQLAIEYFGEIPEDWAVLL